MGLDMYARSVKPNLVTDIGETTIGNIPDGSSSELFYWRKHPNLHGWMERLYRKKGGSQEFNLTHVKLTGDDLDALEKTVKAGGLPRTGGFFFGESDGSEKSQDLEFIAKAREALAAGNDVIYYAWW